jgi:hypothetical protein
MVIKRLPELAGKKPSPQAMHINVNGHDVVEVTFTKEQAILVIERAVIKAKAAIKEAGTFGPKEYEKIIRTNKVGFLGQVAWFIYAEDDFPKGLSTIKIGFQPDDQDFIFKGYKGDVKCAGRLDADLMMTPEYRFRNKRLELYVGSRLMSENPHIIQLWGYATRKEVEDNGYINDFGYGDTRCYRLEWLHPIISLRDISNKSPQVNL